METGLQLLFFQDSRLRLLISPIHLLAAGVEAQVGAVVDKGAVVGIDTQVKVEIGVEIGVKVKVEIGVEIEYFISKTIQIITNHCFG